MAKKDTTPAQKEGFATLLAPDGATGCSFGGTEYTVVDGTVQVPVEAVNDLTAHGFLMAD